MYQRVLVISKYRQEIVQLNDEHLNDAIHYLLDGGFYEIVRCQNLPKNILMLVDDEGAIKGLPINPLATLLYDEVIRGKAIIMREYRNQDGEPDITGLTEYDLNRVLSAIQQIMFGGKDNASI